MRRIWLSCLVVFFLTAGGAHARNFWEKPYTEWSQREAARLLSDSPWAGQNVFSRNLMEGRFESGIGGAREAQDAYTARFFSALPVRKAYARLIQLNHNYDEMPDEQKEHFDAQLEGFLSNRLENVVVALNFSSTDRSMEIDVMRTLNNLRTTLLQGQAFLTTGSAGMVPMKEYHPPAQDGTGARFIFPKTVDGKPILTEEDREVTFSFELPDYRHKIYIRWRVADMMYEGELEY